MVYIYFIFILFYYLSDYHKPSVAANNEHTSSYYLAEYMNAALQMVQ